MFGFVQSLVSLPPELQAAIGAVVAFVVAFALNQIALLWPWLADYLGPYKDQAIAALSAAIVAWITTQLNGLPTYEPVITAALQFIVVLIGFFGLPFLTFKYLQRKGVRGFSGYSSKPK